MARHFLSLYLLIVVTLAAVSWGQDSLLRAYGRQSAASLTLDNPSQTAVLNVIEAQLRDIPAAERRRYVASLAAKTGTDLELFDTADIAGRDTLARLARGEPALMNAADGRDWLLKAVGDDGRVLAFRYTPPPIGGRDTLEWVLALTFYAAIALVLMAWLWPLTRDLRRLERATSTFGNRNWTYSADIKPSSQVHPLAQAFQRMAQRIDSLIGSHKDMSNAMSHEIKTPLSRMRFEIEMARTAASADELASRLNNINSDIAELNAFVTATLDYSILERAEVALNIGEHDFTLILPAVTESVARSARSELQLRCEVQPDATAVSCDAHLLETVLRNLLYNAIRYARREIRVAFVVGAGGRYRLSVDDDGPGIPEPDRRRVFDSFVQLEPSGGKAGYGLGLAIVRRIIEWHNGTVAVSQSPLGGAAFVIEWSVPRAIAGS